MPAPESSVRPQGTIQDLPNVSRERRLHLLVVQDLLLPLHHPAVVQAPPPPPPPGLKSSPGVRSVRVSKIYFLCSVQDRVPAVVHFSMQLEEVETTTRAADKNLLGASLRKAPAGGPKPSASSGGGGGRGGLLDAIRGGKRCRSGYCTNSPQVSI